MQLSNVMLTSKFSTKINLVNQKQTYSIRKKQKQIQNTFAETINRSPKRSKLSGIPILVVTFDPQQDPRVKGPQCRIYYQKWGIVFISTFFLVYNYV